MVETPMEQRRGRATAGPRRAKFALGGALVIVTLFGLVGWAMSRPGSTSFYMTVGEIQASGPTQGTAEVKVNGKVVPGTVEKDGLTTSFAITDGTRALTVSTESTLPDAFYSDRDQIEVIAQGRYDGRLFTASNVFAKCPSKFKAKA
jgi:cytochrome c-type biogenesis protein CcmE